MPNLRRLLRKSGVLLWLGVGISRADGQELEPRAYSNIPVGLNFLLGGYGYTHGNIVTDETSPLQNARIEARTAVVAYARSLDLWGKSGKLDVIVPYSWASGEATLAGQPVGRNVSGFADPRFRLTTNLYGAPALSMSEFAGYRQDVIVGAGLQISAPLGQYDADRLVNIGTNRWFVKPEVGVSKASGPLTLELVPSVTFFSTNHDFLGSRTREQDPLYAVQGHLVYGFGGGYWGALDATFYAGGRTTVDEVASNDRQENWRLGATVAVPVTPRHSVKVYASTGVSTRAGSDFDAVGLAWQYRWGDGM